MGIFRANVAFIEKLRDNHGDEIKTVSELLEISSVLATEISRLHQMNVSALEIAEALEFEPGEDHLDELVLNIYPLYRQQSISRILLSFLLIGYLFR